LRHHSTVASIILKVNLLTWFVLLTLFLRGFDGDLIESFPQEAVAVSRGDAAHPGGGTATERCFGSEPETAA
jgi:hypothetical protein